MSCSEERTYLALQEGAPVEVRMLRLLALTDHDVVAVANQAYKDMVNRDNCRDETRIWKQCE